MRGVLASHAARHPLWQVEDVYKLVHQAAMGSEHAVLNEAAARAWLVRELREMGPGPNEPLIDPIAADGSIVRVHLRPFARLGLDAEMLLAAFLRTAREVRGSASLLESGLADAERLAGEGLMALDPKSIELVAKRMKAVGFPAVHHSAAYVAAYRPAYRVVARTSMAAELTAIPDGESGSVNVPGDVRALCVAFLVGLEDVLRGKLHAVYVYGAVTFPETTHTGDVDFHVILSQPPTNVERSALLALHAGLAEEFPPLGAEHYILLADARGTAPPQHLLFPHLFDDSFALHRAHMLAGQVLVLRGPDPREIYAPPAWVELAEALDGELDYVARHLAKYPAYCVLNLCRLLYSWETRDVVTSKAVSAVWARGRVLEWAHWIDLSIASYAGVLLPEGETELASGTRDLYRSALERISALRRGAN